MAGIYIHIPFCKRACHYCNFHFSTTRTHENEIREALLKEVSLQSAYLGKEPVRTIYFGGGTPSLMPDFFLKQMLSAIRANFQVDADPEITLEANPDDVQPGTVESWAALGINRLSIGVQSFFDADLEWMNRAHNAGMAEDAIGMAQQAGIRNISIDLIYGGPTLPDENWIANLEKAAQLEVPHLSCYALTVEPSTALDLMILKEKKEAVDPDRQARHFELLQSKAPEFGFEHYEISNLAKPGFRSKHNTAYWQGVPYLGIGPSAHSFNGKSRQWNVANNALYLTSIQNGTVPFEEEILTKANRLNEYIMTSLRTIEGLSLERYVALAEATAVQELLKAAAPHILNGNAILTETHIRITEKGRFLADGIASDLFVEE